jgi:hypothetical protein
VESQREHVFPSFEGQEHCRIRAVNIEAADTLKKIEVMHRADRMVSRPVAPG